jgi:hypothetical protein
LIDQRTSPFLALTMFTIALGLTAHSLTVRADTPDPKTVDPKVADLKAIELADQVMKAAGADQWLHVKRVQFMFNLEEKDDVILSAKHDWDVKAGTDTVSWAGQSVTIHIDHVGSGDNDAKAALGRWVNDAFWLLLPLRLKEPTVILRYDGEQETDGRKLQVLHAGYTSNIPASVPPYNLYIDSESHRVVKLDRLLTSDKKTTVTFEKYETFGPFTLPTEFRKPKQRMFYTDVSIETE